MCHRIAALLALVATAAPTFALSGYAHGVDHCYHFDAPPGWRMDNSAGARDGLPMVFYPNGSTWQSAPVAIYTRPNASKIGRSGAARIAEQVNQVLEMYRANSENLQASRVRTVRSKAGAEGELWQYMGYSNGGAELAVYYPAARTVNFFVMQIPQAASVSKHMPVLLEIAESYRTASDCQPCSVSSACKSEN